MASGKAKKQSFEEAMEKLEHIIEKLENENLVLDDALDYFGKGVDLMKSCEAHLKGAEGRLRELLKGENGEFAERVLGITLESVVGGEDFEQ